MCALAHFFEEEGLSTSVVALVREHVQQMRPPRALWVPFELGRPFGNPDNAAQHTQVLLAALHLLEASDCAPILRDFTETEAVADEDEEWQFPGLLATDNVHSELNSVRTEWEQARGRYGRSTVGMSGLSPEEAVAFIHRYHSSKPMPNPKGMAVVARARFSIDDIKAFYLEAASAAGNPSSHQLQNWFWQETMAGAMILEFQEQTRLSEDKNLLQISDSIVPAERVISRR